MLNILNRLWMKSNDGASSINWKRSRVARAFVRILRVLFISGRTSSRITWLLLGSIVCSLLLFPLIFDYFAHLTVLYPQDSQILLECLLPLAGSSPEDPVPVKEYCNPSEAALSLLYICPTF